MADQGRGEDGADAPAGDDGGRDASGQDGPPSGEDLGVEKEHGDFGHREGEEPGELDGPLELNCFVSRLSRTIGSLGLTLRNLVMGSSPYVSINQSSWYPSPHWKTAVSTMLTTPFESK